MLQVGVSRRCAKNALIWTHNDYMIVIVIVVIQKIANQLVKKC